MMAMNQLGAFLVIIALSAHAHSSSAYPEKPSTSTNTFPNNILKPLRKLFSKRLANEHAPQHQHQHQHAHHQYQNELAQAQPTPVAIPVQFVPQFPHTQNPTDMAGAEAISNEFNLGQGQIVQRPIPTGASEPDMNEFDSAAPAPQFSLGGRPMRITMRNPFRRPRRPRPQQVGGGGGAGAGGGQQGFQQGGQEQFEQQGTGAGPTGGGGGGGGGVGYNAYPMEHNTVEQFNNDIDVGSGRPSRPSNAAFGHYGSGARGPVTGQSFQQPQQQQFPASYGGGGRQRPMGMGFRQQGGSMSMNANNGRPNGLFPYPSVVRGAGGGGRKPFRPSRPDMATLDETNQFGGGAGGGFGQQGFGFGGGGQDFPSDNGIYGASAGGGSGGGGGGGRGNRHYRQQPYSSASGEPEIITLDDLQNQGYQLGSGAGGGGDFDDGYQGGPAGGQGVRGGGGVGGRFPMRGNQGPSNAYTRPVPSYAQGPQQGGFRRPKAGRIYQSRPLRSPGGRLNPYSAFANSDEVVSVKPFPVVESNEEILYGKPMAMSSTTQKEQSSTTYRPTEHTSTQGTVPRPLPMTNKPYLLKAAKNPNFKKSSTISKPVIVGSGELQQSASNFGGSGGGGDIGNELDSNGDRILFHVSGHKGPYSYRWGYDTGKGYNRMFRFEEKDETGYVRGKYGYEDKHGKMNVVNYEAHPEAGYHQEPTNY